VFVSLRLGSLGLEPRELMDELLHFRSVNLEFFPENIEQFLGLSKTGLIIRDRIQDSFSLSSKIGLKQGLVAL